MGSFREGLRFAVWRNWETMRTERSCLKRFVNIANSKKEEEKDLNHKKDLIISVRDLDNRTGRAEKRRTDCSKKLGESDRVPQFKTI